MRGTFLPRLLVLAALLLAIGGLGGAVGARADDDDGHRGRSGPSFWLTVLHNNDGETKLLPQQVSVGGTLQTYGGIARFATLVDDLRAQATKGRPPASQRGAKRGAILLSSGDNFLAGPQFNASLDKGVPFYDSIGMSLIGYDAVAIGNHEFDFGPDVLADFIRGFSTPTPFLSSNLDFSGEPALQALVRGSRSGGDDDDDDDGGRSRSAFIAESVVVKERGERIGIVGATTPRLPFISSPRNVVVIEDVAGEVQEEVDGLRRHGVNKIILISHLQSVLEDKALAPMLRGIDVMIAGGGDELLAQPGTPLVPGDVIQGSYPTTVTDADGKSLPIVTTAGDYKYVGRLLVGFDRRGNVLQIDPSSGPVRVSGEAPDAVEPDRRIQARVVDPVAAYVADLAANIIGQTEVPLNGTRPAIRTVETNMGNLVADAHQWQATELAPGFGVPTPDVAMVNGGGIRNTTVIPAGPISELDTWNTLSFANFLSVVPAIPAAQLKELLENAVAFAPAQDGRFAHIAGMKFQYATSGTGMRIATDGTVLVPGTRVKHVELDDGTVLVMNGTVVPGAPAVDIATTDFSARGGDQWPFRGAPFTTLGVTYQQALSNFIQAPNGLNRLVRAAEYPVAGEGRIVRLD
jgi:2',3'-cyclic-nucleotide 2'-phosphodiesterase (5'-nucleotidase family)